MSINVVSRGAVFWMPGDELVVIDTTGIPVAIADEIIAFSKEFKFYAALRRGNSLEIAPGGIADLIIQHLNGEVAGMSMREWLEKLLPTRLERFAREGL